ncbi:MAG TPA: BON domain-containing protein [Lysobacter sp.]|nr:BON domain-containing protein [Lysobacter sp.]
MTTLFRIAAAFAAGAAAMYFMDPVVGRRRRALMRDQGVSAGHDVENFVRAKSRRAVHRLNGTVARTRARLSQGPVDDDQLLERIRSRLGHLLEHPRSVEVAVRDGNVVLTGRASAADIDHLMEAISGMRGVEDVENRLWVVRAMTGSQGEQEMRH